MNHVIQKILELSPAIILGWALTIWMPVPSPIRAVMTTTVDAVCNGVNAMVSTVNVPPPKGRPRQTIARK